METCDLCGCTDANMRQVRVKGVIKNICGMHSNLEDEEGVVGMPDDKSNLGRSGGMHRSGRM